ncbi:MAG: hypothetical protein RIS65_1364 [Pseudomonadota bacterium]|jgi:hypothetical protein
MVGTFNKIDYRLRPAKHAERAMLIDLFKRMRFAPMEQYQYVGFGSVAFIDFRMVHRAIGISDMVSIEDTDDDDEKQRFRFNAPFPYVEIKFGNSATVLPTINFARKSLAWLDYDDVLARSMLNDMVSIVSRAKSGSFVAITFNAGFPANNPARSEELERLKQEFPEYLDENDRGNRLNGLGLGNFARELFAIELKKALSDADAGIVDERFKRQLRQVTYFSYKDGARMATIGWLVVSEIDMPINDSCRFDLLPFFRADHEPFKIQVPKVTPCESRAMERRLSDLTNAPDLGWLPIREREAFAESYRYLPNFVTTEQL